MTNRCFRGRLLAGLGILLSFATSTLPTQSTGTFTLVRIDVTGSKRFTVPEIVAASGLKTQQSITPDQLKQVAGMLGGLDVFSQVSYRYRTENTAMTAQFTVEDAPKLLPCAFGNLIWFTPEELTKGLSARLPLYKGSAPRVGTMLDLISQQLVAMLATRGIHAQVEYSRMEQLSGPIQSMQFRQVGVLLPIQKVDFTGVARVDPALLQEAARPLLNQDYDASFIRAFSQNGVGSVYRQRGYLCAQFGEPVPHLAMAEAASNSVSVSLPVSEGDEYRLEELTWAGESVFPYDDLEKKVHERVGARFDAVQLENDLLALLMFYHPRGYLLADVKAIPDLDDSSHLESYRIEIVQGPLFHMAKLEIAGLDDATTNKICQRSRLREGDAYDATYWQNFLGEVIRILPQMQYGWTLTPAETVHRDLKTVDVRLTFAPRTTR